MDRLDLREKYVEIRRLRAEAPAPGRAQTPTLALRALAARFPGALRELDELSMGEIERRIEWLAGTEDDAWLGAQLLFHPSLRGALIAKRWLARRRAIDQELLEAFDREVVDGDARDWRGELARLARPPEGRVIDLVLERVARALGCSVDEARALSLGAAAAARTAARRSR